MKTFIIVIQFLFISIAALFAEEHIVFQEEYKTSEGVTFAVCGINTKNQAAKFDKIYIISGEFVFEVTDIFHSSLDFYHVNGVKEGPMKFYEFIAKEKKSGKKYMFANQDISGYVAALVKSEYNNSTLQIKSKEHRMVLAENDEEGLRFRVDKDKFFSEIPWREDKRHCKHVKGEIINSQTQLVIGNHGTYTVRFYRVTERTVKLHLAYGIDDRRMIGDSTLRHFAEKALSTKIGEREKYERGKEWDNLAFYIKRPVIITIQKEGDDVEYEVRNILLLNAYLKSLADSIFVGNIKAVSLENDFYIAYYCNTIADDKLVDKLIELLNKYGYDSSKYIINGGDVNILLNAE